MMVRAAESMLSQVLHDPEAIVRDDRPGDVDAMRDAVLGATPEAMLAWARAAQARFLREDYRATGMARRHIAISREILTRG